MLEIYNTLNRKKEEFKPLKNKRVGFYQCGPTVYWTQHIGNMRAMVLADLIRRSLEYFDYKVKFVRNYTDVGHMTSDEDEGEDKMEKASKREKLSPDQIADKYIKVFEQDVSDLNCEEPTEKPRATEYIKPMQKMVQTLLDKGYAYATDLAVYFDVNYYIEKGGDYTKLSGQKLEMNRVDAGKGDVSDPQKKSPIDFAVWFFKAGAHQNALQTWPSKFKLPAGKTVEGDGFPGWHLECSAMNKAIFGDTIDLHMGGIEHIPVHHTNEIAQSEAASGVKFVDYWLHNEHLTVDGGKMSKSGGTAYSLADIKAKGYDPLVLRYFFCQAHYRSQQNFTWEALDAAKTSLNNLHNEIISLFPQEELSSFENKFLSASDEADCKKEREFIVSYQLIIKKALEEDFNVPKVLAVLWGILKDNISDGVKKKLILDIDKILGLNLNRVEVKEISQSIINLAEKRLEARQSKDWKKSDELRDEINKLGFDIEDTKDGYKLKKK
ncbi:MAG: cysteine--tRNA ligase [Patescibacteria group bacterium]